MKRFRENHVHFKLHVDRLIVSVNNFTLFFEKNVLVSISCTREYLSSILLHSHRYFGRFHRAQCFCAPDFHACTCLYSVSVRKTQSSVRTHCVESRLLGRLILGIIRLIIQHVQTLSTVLSGFLHISLYKAHSHRANAKAKNIKDNNWKRSKKKIQTWKKKFAFAFAFVWCEQALNKVPLNLSVTGHTQFCDHL